MAKEKTEKKEIAEKKKEEDSQESKKVEEVKVAETIKEAEIEIDGEKLVVSPSKDAIALEKQKEREALANALADKIIQQEREIKEKKQQDYDKFFDTGFHKEEFYLPEIEAHSERAMEVLQFRITKNHIVAIAITGIAFCVMLIL